MPNTDDRTSRPQTAKIQRVIYKEIKDGDRRKFIAESNDAKTGGGARDLRFPYKMFQGQFSKLFPARGTAVRRRGGVRGGVPVLLGEFWWVENGTDKSMESQFDPPTDARGSEGRIIQINKYPCFAELPDTTGGKVLLLLIQRSDGTVWPGFATEHSLKGSGWNHEVADALLRCIQARRREGTAIAGYLDFETEQEFCNGD